LTAINNADIIVTAIQVYHQNNITEVEQSQ